MAIVIHWGWTGTSAQLAWNTCVWALAVVAVILVVFAPKQRFRWGWISKAGWIAVAVLLNVIMLNGYACFLSVSR